MIEVCEESCIRMSYLAVPRFNWLNADIFIVSIGRVTPKNCMQFLVIPSSFKNSYCWKPDDKFRRSYKIVSLSEAEAFKENNVSFGSKTHILQVSPQ